MLLSDGTQMGLGLFISKQIVTKFNGSLDFVSKYEQGSTFFFSFDLEFYDYQIDENEAEEQTYKSPRFNEASPVIIINQINNVFN